MFQNRAAFKDEKNPNLRRRKKKIDGGFTL